ncbi:MAG: (Fe-S)-binding protein [Chloroflexi bacterium]|jgi:Fe-S oxidoreductase|nr:(Fe-S)-binding protein [Chloroflexota bacterium]
MSVAPDKETVDILLMQEEDQVLFKTCYQCGTCTGTCPWNLVKNFTVRKIMHKAQLGLIDFGEEDIWQCATCGACVSRCPRGVEIIDVMKAFRKIIAEMGVAKVPDSLRMSVKNIASLGNPMAESDDKRGNWMEAAGVKAFTPETEYLYFSCCVPAFDGKIRRMANSTAAILNKAGVDFGALGNAEKCCGESVRKAGSESTFMSLAQSNIEAFAGAKKVLATSPHCYHTFKNEYPDLGAEFEVTHYTQMLDQLIQDGKLTFSKEVKAKVIYHDPCYLGRHNDEYEAPRRVLQAIPGVELIEFPDNRQSAVCCGGGGGRVWMETPVGERFSELKVEQAVEAGAEVLAVACPYCMLMFDDALLVTGKEDVLKVKDISELVLEAL